MKIAYLHGLESDNKGPKNDWLREIADDVYDPLIDYTEPGIYKKIIDEVTDFDPDIILGSSMGGYFAYHIARTNFIPALLFNPAIPYRSFQPDMKGQRHVLSNPRIHIVFGRKDDLIKPADTIQTLKSTRFTSDMGSHGHRTPTKVFKDSVEKFIATK